jgi:hypothetical protein
VAHEASKVARDLFTLTASWLRLLGRAFVTRAARRRARALLLERAPGAAAGAGLQVVDGTDDL